MKNIVVMGRNSVYCIDWFNLSETRYYAGLSSFDGLHLILDADDLCNDDLYGFR